METSTGNYGGYEQDQKEMRDMQTDTDQNRSYTQRKK